MDMLDEAPRSRRTMPTCASAGACARCGWSAICRWPSWPQGRRVDRRAEPDRARHVVAARQVIWPLAAALDIEPSALIADGNDAGQRSLLRARRQDGAPIPVKSEGIAKALLSPPGATLTGHAGDGRSRKAARRKPMPMPAMNSASCCRAKSNSRSIRPDTRLRPATASPSRARLLHAFRNPGTERLRNPLGQHDQAVRGPRWRLIRSSGSDGGFEDLSRRRRRARRVDLDIVSRRVHQPARALGCGKTTSLRVIAGFESPSSGKVLLEGRDVTALRPFDGRSTPCSRTTRCFRI